MTIHFGFSIAEIADACELTPQQMYGLPDMLQSAAKTYSVRHGGVPLQDLIHITVSPVPGSIAKRIVDGRIAESVVKMMLEEGVLTLKRPAIFDLPEAERVEIASRLGTKEAAPPATSVTYADRVARQLGIAKSIHARR